MTAASSTRTNTSRRWIGSSRRTIRTVSTRPVRCEGYEDFTFGSVASYSALDDNTVQFKLKEPSAAFLNSLAMVWNGVVSYQAAAKYGKDFRNNPVGTGPFIFREWKSRDQIVLDANPNYWKGKPKLDHIVFKVYPDAQAALLALQHGETQIMGDVATQVIPALRADHNLTVLTQPGLTVNGMAMPNDTAPFNDKRVRQALNYAVDKEAINKALYGGLAVTMTSPLPEAQWGFDKSLKGYPYDPAKAKQLLAAAGVKPGLKVELLSYNTPRGYNPAGADLAVALQGYLRKVGIEADIQKNDMGAFLATVRSGQLSRAVPDRLERRQRRSRQLRRRAVGLVRDAGERHVALQGSRGGQADAAGGQGSGPCQAHRDVRADPEDDPGWGAVDLRELDATGSCGAEERAWVRAQPDADVLRYGSGVATVGAGDGDEAYPRDCFVGCASSQ